MSNKSFEEEKNEVLKEIEKCKKEAEILVDRLDNFSRCLYKCKTTEEVETEEILSLAHNIEEGFKYIILR